MMSTPIAVLLAVPTLILWATWYLRMAAVTTMASQHSQRMLLYLAPPLCLTLLAACLRGWEGDLPGDNCPLPLFFVVGAICLFVGVWALPWLDLDPRDDAVERRNFAAAWAVVGAMIGLTLLYAGFVTRLTSARGEWAEWASLLAGGIAIVVLLVFGSIVNFLTGLSEAITVDRDGGAALRLAGVFVAGGLLLGQALPQAAPSGPARLGNPAPWKPFVLLAAPFVLLVLAVLVERRRTPRVVPLSWPRRQDVIVALSYVLGATLVTYLPR